MVKRAKLTIRHFTGSNFQHELEMESLRAERGRCPLSLVLFAPKIQNTHSKEAHTQELLRSIEFYTIPCDSLGLLPEMRYALILPGAGVFRAQNIAESILQHFENLGHYYMVGISNAEAPEYPCAETLLQQAIAALHQIQEQDGKICIYREQAENLSRRRTLVHSHEKRFLFSGGE